MGWIKKAQDSENTKQDNAYNEFSQSEVDAFASVFTHLSESQIRTILAQSDGDCK